MAYEADWDAAAEQPCSCHHADATHRLHGIAPYLPAVKILNYEYGCFVRHVQETLLSSGGTIFGGSVLLGVLKHDAQRNFYRHLDLDAHAYHLPSRELYEDQNCHPESYELRTTFPRDIDVFFGEEEEWEEAKAKFEDELKGTRVRETDWDPPGAYETSPTFTEHFHRKCVFIEHLPLQACYSDRDCRKYVMRVKVDVIVRRPNEESEHQTPWGISNHPNMWKHMLRTPTSLELPQSSRCSKSPTSKAIHMESALQMIRARQTASSLFSMGFSWVPRHPVDTFNHWRLAIKELKAGWLLEDFPLELSSHAGTCAYCNRECFPDLQVKKRSECKAHSKCLMRQLRQRMLEGQTLSSLPPPLPEIPLSSEGGWALEQNATQTGDHSGAGAVA